MVQWTTIIY